MCKKVVPTYFVPFFHQLLLILLNITLHQKKSTYINCTKFRLPLPERVLSQGIKVIPPKPNNNPTERDDLKVYKTIIKLLLTSTTYFF